MHYVCSDIHGVKPLWDKVKEKLNKDDILYFLGDAIDRGPDGFEILTEMLDDERVIYLKGNHEFFAETFLKDAAGAERWEEIDKDIIAIWSSNGGEAMMNKIWFDMSKGQSKELYFKLSHLPQKMEVVINDTKFLLSHAGYTPRFLERDIAESADLLVWDRKHFSYTWDEEEDGENVIVLHGHTPVGFLRTIGDMTIMNHHADFSDEESKSFVPYIYADGHKIDLDLCSFVSDRLALYCLETKTWKILEV